MHVSSYNDGYDAITLIVRTHYVHSDFVFLFFSNIFFLLFSLYRLLSRTRFSRVSE